MTLRLQRQLYVRFDPYELALLEKLYADLCFKAQLTKTPRPTKKELIQGCVRTAIHLVYGKDYIYNHLLSLEELKKLMKDAGEDPADLEEPVRTTKPKDGSGGGRKL